MSLLSAIKTYLWRPFEIHSTHKPKEIEHELSKRIIKEPMFHLGPYYEKLYGKVEGGKFTIKYAPRSSMYMRGAGSVRIQGKIENMGKRCRVCGYLPGPPFAIWFFIAFWFGLAFFHIFMRMARHESIQWDFLLVIALIDSIFSVVIFLFDRFVNQDGERMILNILKKVAD